MVIVKLMGGLGNQMFQYAIGRHLAIINNTELKLDITAFQEDSLRDYKLHLLRIVENLATADEVNKCCKIYEEGLGFHSDMLQKSGDIYLIGYWQSELYFKSIGDTIRHEFLLKDDLDLSNAAILEAIEKTCSVGIHVRRGDYISNKDTNNYLGVCPIAYYKQSVQNLLKRLDDVHFYIFSDDPDWVESEPFFQELPATIIKNNRKQEWVDIKLMSACKHFIIANSSFSWWGAWLSPQIEKIVYAPLQWFQNITANSSDIVPSTWKRL